MRSLLKKVRIAFAKCRLLRISAVEIGSNTRVNYVGIVNHPPSKLRIGDGTIFEGNIASDRDGSEVSIGKNSFIGASTFVCAERIDIGDDVMISWGCTIVDHSSHAVEWSRRKDDVKDYLAGKKNWAHVECAGIVICDKAWVGFNTIILKGVTIGEGAIVGAGSVVTKDVAPYTVVAGNPARIIRSIHDANSAA